MAPIPMIAPPRLKTAACTTGELSPSNTVPLRITKSSIADFFCVEVSLKKQGTGNIS
jgi:hypothetical protein